MKNPETFQQLLKNSDLILSELKKLEPAQNEVCATHTSRLNVVFEGKDFSVSTSSATAMYGIRSIVNGKLGFITTNANGADQLKEAAKEAQLLARLSVPSEHHQIAGKVDSAEVAEFRGPF